MRQALAQLNMLPGAIGSLVTDRGGKILERVFPPLFDDASLSAVSEDVAECAIALGVSSVSTETVFLRYAEGIVTIKPLDGGLLLLLCTRESSRKLMNCAIAAAAARLQRVMSPAPPSAQDGSNGPTSDRLAIAMSSESYPAE